MAESASETNSEGRFFLTSQRGAFPISLRLDASDHFSREVEIPSPRDLADLELESARTITGVVEGPLPEPMPPLFVRCEFVSSEGRRNCGFSSVGSDGAFVVETAPYGPLRLSLALEEESARGPFVELDSDQNSALITYNEGTTLHGIVRNSRTREPVGNIGVMLLNPDSREMVSAVVTDEDGAFSASFLPDGSIVLRVSDAAYFDKEVELELPEAETVEVELDELKIVDLEVLVTQNGDPIEGLDVRADDTSTGRRVAGMTGKDGVARLQVVAADSVRVSAQGAGWISNQRTLDLSKTDRRSVEINALRMASLRGTYVKSRCVGTPEVSLRYLDGRSLRARAGRHESFYFEGLQPGEVWVTARCGGQLVFERAISIESGEVFDIGIVTF